MFRELVINSTLTDTLLRIVILDITTFHGATADLEDLARLIKSDPFGGNQFYETVTAQLEVTVTRGRSAERSLETLLSVYHYRLTVVLGLPVDDFYVSTLQSLARLKEQVDELALYLLIRSIDRELPRP